MKLTNIVTHIIYIYWLKNPGNVGENSKWNSVAIMTFQGHIIRFVILQKENFSFEVAAIFPFHGAFIRHFVSNLMHGFS